MWGMSGGVFKYEKKKKTYTEQFKKKVTLSEGIQNAFCCGIAILQHGLP
jgi:hypothetical protein